MTRHIRGLFIACNKSESYIYFVDGNGVKYLYLTQSLACRYCYTSYFLFEFWYNRAQFQL